MSSRSSRALVLLCQAASVAACGTDILVARDEAPLEAGAPELDAGLTDAEDAGEIPGEDGGQIRCGSTLCGQVELGGAFGQSGPCCYNSRCGALLSSICVELDAPGTQDPTCPSIGAGVGCCRADNTCGIEVPAVPLGCFNPFSLFPGVSSGVCVYPDE